MNAPAQARLTVLIERLARLGEHPIVDHRIPWAASKASIEPSSPIQVMLGHAAEVQNCDRPDRQLRKQRPMVDGNQRGPLSPAATSAARHVVDDLDPQGLRERVPIANLHREPRVRLMQHGLPVKAMQSMLRGSIS